MYLHKFQKRGYTLVEALIAMVILSMLFIILISRIDFSTDLSKKKVVESDFIYFENAIKEVGRRNWGLTEGQEELLNQINSQLPTEKSLFLDGTGMTSNASDPWGAQYKLQYLKPQDTLGQITILSAGPDGNFDTEDDIKRELRYDISSGTAILLINGIPDDSN